MKIIKNTLIQNYAQSMGIEAARELVTKKIKSADLDEKEHYTEEETAKIYSELIKEGGLISTVTQNLLVKLERKRLEERTLLLDNIENQIWYLTDKKTYGIVNKAHAEFIGLEKEQLEGKDLHDIIGVKEADIFIANNREVFEKKKQSHTEEWIKNGRGNTRLLSITRTPKLNGNGDVEYVICAAEDITERKRAVDALWESEEKYRTLIENLEDVIVSFSLDGTISYCSPNVKKFGGYDAVEEIGHNFSRYIAGDEAKQKLQDLFQDIILKKKPVSFEFLFKPKSKEPFYVESTASPNINGISNAIVSIQCIIRDITERKQAEEALHKSEEKFRLLAENSVNCIWVLDTKLRFIYLSPSTERILGYKPEQMIGTNLSSHLKTKEFLKIAALADNAIKNYKTFTHLTFETKMLNSKKDEVDIEITSRLLFNNQGKLLGLQGVTRDITERKQVEAELQQLNDELEGRVIERTDLLNERKQALLNLVDDFNQTTNNLKFANERLLELDRMKSMFIASTSHELRTPLNSVIGFSSILLEGWAGEINPEQKEQLQLIHTAGKQLLALINDIIDISKIEAGKLEIDIQEFGLKEVIDEALSLVKNNIDEKGLDLNMEVEDITITSDRRRLLQCLINLLSNAVKFTDKGMITLHAKTINSMVHISVTDTGTGIVADNIPKLFGPFVRLESSLSAKTQGTGLGLYLTKKLTEDVLEGRVGLTSEYGTGSTFTIKIPVKLEKHDNEEESK